MAAPRFEIPSRPERHFPSAGGVEYRGGSVFELAPRREGRSPGSDDTGSDDPGSDDTGSDDPGSDDTGSDELVDLVDVLLETGPYQCRAFGELPMPLWLVRDRETGDTFRVAVRDGEVRLHVLPETESAGLRAFYDRLQASDEGPDDWEVSASVKD